MSEIQRALAAGNSACHLATIAPLPTSIADTGLSASLVADLVAKHLLDGGILGLQQLADRLALAGKILEEVLHYMRSEALVEILAGIDRGEILRYTLTDRGRRSALDAVARNGYIGPAPVTLNQYREVVERQTVHHGQITRDRMAAAFADTILSQDLLDQIGPSLNSGRAIFMYGAAGTGKTYISKKLCRLFGDTVLVPHAIVVNETTISVFDPVQHRPIPNDQPTTSLMFENRYDKRWVPCERPILITGGELTADLLEIQLEPLTKEYRAPLQLKANNGILIIDDMGRQRIAPEVVFNRWIVPMEEQIDYLSLGAGRHFSVPFDLVLVFSTNMNPSELADEAFLRRIGYKIRFDSLDESSYKAIWLEVCNQRGISCSPTVVDFVLHNLHRPSKTDLLPCHPRDLLGIAVDRLTYLNRPLVLENDDLQWAWNSYFVNLNEADVTQPLKRGI